MRVEVAVAGELIRGGLRRRSSMSACQLVDGLAAQAEVRRHCVNRLSEWPANNSPSGAAAARSARRICALRRLVEIDHHVAAEDRVERPAHRPVRSSRLTRRKSISAAQLRAHARLPSLRAGAALEEAPQRSGSMRSTTLQRIDALGGRGEHLVSMSVAR